MLGLALLWGLVCHTTFLVVLASVGSDHGGKEDPHGGVPMGVPNHSCDDGKNFTSIDWDPSSTDEHTCLEGRDLDVLRSSYESCEDTADRPIHVCFPEQISYDKDLPTSGRHRPQWPQYGEYRYLPPQRWLHSLEHGAVVFLYNPCANRDQISKLKALARGCMRRHIISPSKRIPKPNVFAVLAWKCKMVMTHVDVPKTVDFVRRHALHSPERSVYTDGQYSIALIHHAKMVTDNEETELCPQMSMMAGYPKLISEMSRQRTKRLNELRNLMERYLNSVSRR